MNQKIVMKQSQPHVRLRLWFYRLSVWAFALVILFALIFQADWRSTFDRLADVNIAIILTCTAGWLSSFIFRALRFQSEWKHTAAIPFFNALKLTLLHNAAVLVTPFRAGEMGYPVLVRRLIPVSWQQSVRSLLWLRFQDGVVLLCFAWLLLPKFQIELRIVGLMALFFLLWLFRKQWIRVLRSRNFFVSQLRTFLHQRSDGWGWFWSAANWAVKITVVSIMLTTLTGISSLTSIKGALAGELSALLPITGPAGMGTYEAGVWAGTALPWTEMKALMSGVLITHLFFLLISLAASIIALLAGGMNRHVLPVHQSFENDAAISN